LDRGRHREAFGEGASTAALDGIDPNDDMAMMVDEATADEQHWQKKET
jgi:hypothetical protein